uniref:Nicotinamide riboside kinase 1 n=1 Tax=Poecilia reticulata TaxID=8081 RepID=A0A3P9PJ85_POERE
MKTIIVGVGGVTNGGKSTLSQFLHQKIHNSSIIDDFVVPLDSNGFKQYDTLDALHMEEMMKEVYSWRKDPHEFLRRRGLIAKDSSADDELYILIVEGFLIFNHSMRVYAPPDPPNYFDGYVWPMYLQNREEMERITSEIVFLDGLKPKDEVLAAVYEDIRKEIARLQGKAAS